MMHSLKFKTKETATTTSPRQFRRSQDDVTLSNPWVIPNDVKLRGLTPAMSAPRGLTIVMSIPAGYV